jgi:hypothetical protein
MNLLLQSLKSTQYQQDLRIELHMYYYQDPDLWYNLEYFAVYQMNEYQTTDCIHLKRLDNK